MSCGWPFLSYSFFHICLFTNRVPPNHAPLLNPHVIPNLFDPPKSQLQPLASITHLPFEISALDLKPPVVHFFLLRFSPFFLLVIYLFRIIRFSQFSLDNHSAEAWTQHGGALHYCTSFSRALGSHSPLYSFIHFDLHIIFESLKTWLIVPTNVTYYYYFF